MNPVRKSLLLILLLLCMVSSLALADTECTLNNCSGRFSLRDDYIVLTPENLDSHPDLIESIGMSKEDLLADWSSRGVQLQAWTKKMDARLEVSVLQDEDALRFYDTETQQDRQGRNEYKKLQLNALKAADTILPDGIDWKKHKEAGNFLRYSYKYTRGETTYRGVAAKIVRNGYTVLFDLQVYNRTPRKSDQDAMSRILNTVIFEKVAPQPVDPAAATGDGSDPVPQNPVLTNQSGLLNITLPPPEETNEAAFTIEGKTTPGAHLIAVGMRWSSSTAHRFTADASKAGNFKINVTLPEEGVWQFTLNLEVEGQIVADAVLNTTTYSSTLLPLKLDAPVPETVNTNELTVSGVTSKGVDVQCILTDNLSKADVFNKTVRTNGTGTFRFKLPTTEEKEYIVTLSLSKKNYQIRSEQYRTTRSYTAEDNRNHTASKAISPAYNALVKNLDSYIGQTITYNTFITDVQQAEDGWIITGALKKNGKNYSNYIIFMAAENPGVEAGAKIKMYGTCVGDYQIQSEEGIISYPAFNFLFHE